MCKKIVITLVIVLLVSFSFLLWERLTTVSYFGQLGNGISLDRPVDQSKPSDEELEMESTNGVYDAIKGWKKRTAYLMPKEDEEEGTTAGGFKYSYRFHRELGLHFNRVITDPYHNPFREKARKHAYDAWVRDKLKKEGVPEWSRREQVPPLDVMVDYITGNKPMTLVDKFPFKISEKIYLRMGANRPLGDNFTQVEIVYKNFYALYGDHTGKSNDGVQVEAEDAEKKNPYLRQLKLLGYRDDVTWFNVYPHKAEDKPIYFARFEKHPETMIFRIGDIEVQARNGRTIIATLRKSHPSDRNKKPHPENPN